MKILLGKISTRACNGPASFCAEAFDNLSITPDDVSYLDLIFSMVFEDIPTPGFTTLTIPNPIKIATNVVVI